MAVQRENPYGAFKFQVNLGDKNDAENTWLGGFSDVSGLGTEVNYSDYRNGNDKENTLRKVQNTFKQEDVTLKRGLVGATRLFEWIKRVREGGYEPQEVSITMYDESGQNPVATFRLQKAQPKKWVGPTLAAKGGGEVAMEELHLVHEGIRYE